MTSQIRHVTFDSADPRSAAEFWAAALGGAVRVDEEDGSLEVAVVTDAGTDLLFLPVPEGKSVKNRVHLDIQPQDRSRDAEVERLLALGATLVDDRRRPDGLGWAVLADPEGNEFCVERSRAEREATA